jgi:RNA polymerase sigma-70 factor (ECF subfamily)
MRVDALLSESNLVDTYRNTIGPLYAYVSRRVGGDAALAEDLVQDTWTRAIADWPANGLPREPLAWLIRVARNTLVSYFRRLRPELVDPVLLDLIGCDDARLAAAESPGTASVINWGLTRLRRPQRELLDDFYFEGKSVREIARARRLSERAVEGRLRRAREKLKRKIERMLPRATRRGRGAQGAVEHVRPTRTS